MGSRGRSIALAEYRFLVCGLVPTAWYSAERLASPVAAWSSARRMQGLRAAVGLVLCGELGLRVGEATRVTFDDLRPVLGGARHFLLPGGAAKGGAERTVVAGLCVGLVLRSWLWELRQVGSVPGFVGGGAGPVRVVALTVRGLQAAFCRLGLRFLGHPVWPHDLRRLFGERCRMLGDVRLAQLQLGHRSLASTERYLGGSLAERESLVERMQVQIFGPAGSAGGEVGFSVGDVSPNAWPRSSAGPVAAGLVARPVEVAAV